MHIQRETALGGFHKKSAYCNDGPTCGNRQMQKAEGPRSGTVAFAADCAFIALLRAWTKACVLLLLCAATCEPASKCKQCVNEWSVTKWSWMSEHSVCYLHLPIHETWLPGNVVSGNGTKYGWSERHWRRPYILLVCSFKVTVIFEFYCHSFRKIWRRVKKWVKDSKPMKNTQNNSVV